MSETRVWFTRRNRKAVEPVPEKKKKKTIFNKIFGGRENEGKNDKRKNDK